MNARFAEMVDAVRLGTWFFHDPKAYGRWKAQSTTKRQKSKGLADLVKAAGGVTRHHAEFRN